MHPEAGRSHGKRALDQVVGLVGLAFFEKNLGEICRPLGFKPWPLEDLAHPQVLFCAEEVASFPADDAPDQVSHRQIHDVAPVLRRRDRRRQRASRLVHLARERQRVQRVHREQQLVHLGERAERLRAAGVLDRACSRDAAALFLVRPLGEHECGSHPALESARTCGFQPVRA